ncbi:MAG: PHB depolymerase family esterase [Clostridium saudiense]|uniref:alpha/beta hydrolase family esterase n=1 Tax=Clostridium saudiense TaxID=1414720 RepID=UPI00290E6EEB|nr:PHB depolymerase family esterase [Clostridium saudiense]MDU3520952.1 PHB depolymerase family esterase [Clostridium saudiense]
MIKKWIKISILLATITSTTMGLISCGNSVTNTSGNNIESSEQAQVLNDGSKLKLAKNEDGTDTNYYYYNAYEDGFTPTRADVVIPTYYIFAGSKTQEEANKIVEELNMINNLEQWGAQVYVVNPLNEEGYGNDDKEAFIDLVGIGVKNVKVIGIDEGSTFVNNYISQSCYFVAGMMLYGGEINENLEKNDVVPAYLSNSNENVQAFYKHINEATEEENSDKYTIYRNKDNSLQAVAVSSKEEDLSEAFNNAWESIFSQNYRQHNDISEFYNLSARDVTDSYDLIEIPIFEDLDISYNQMIDESVTGMSGKYTWFEYVPNSINESENESVPLIVNLHGNQNDPRLQGDSTGWPELAAKENFIMVAPEWQDKEVNFFGCDGLGEEGVMNLIKDLKVKYPQIDPSRIYLTGLSIGGAESFLLGAKYSDVFAAVGIVAGVNVFAEEVAEISENYTGGEVPLLYICGDHDFFQMIPVDGSSQYGTQYLYGDQVWDEDENTHIFSSLQAYQKINGLEVTEMDMSKNEYYGIGLDNQQWTKLGDKDMYTGTLSNENGVVMELAAVKDLAHWNYKPEAEYIWNFFKNYERNIENGELIFK